MASHQQCSLGSEVSSTIHSMKALLSVHRSDDAHSSPTSQQVLFIHQARASSHDRWSQDSPVATASPFSISVRPDTVRFSMCSLVLRSCVLSLSLVMGVTGPSVHTHVVSDERTLKTMEGILAGRSSLRTHIAITSRLGKWCERNGSMRAFVPMRTSMKPPTVSVAIPIS